MRAPWAQFDQRVAHHLHPPRRHAPLVAVVELRRHRLLDQVVEGGRFQFVAATLVEQTIGGRNLPAVLTVVPLVPPAVPDGQVEPAVEGTLHSGRAARLQRSQRIIQPDVAAVVQLARHRHVVVGQERDAVPHFWPVGELDHLLDQGLPTVVGGMRLTRHDQLNRALVVEQQLLQALGVAQHQRQPLVRRHPPGEPDGQHIGIESSCDPA